MNITAIEESFREKVCAKVRVALEDDEWLCVFTPFLLEDGDHLAIVLKKKENTWILSDGQLADLHLTHDLDEKDFQKGTHQKIIGNALSAFRVEDRDGELILSVSEDHFGDALCSFVQALLNVIDGSFLTRERVGSTFMEDFHSLIEDKAPETRRTFNWYDTQHDPQARYIVDCRVGGMRKSLMVFALPSDGRTRNATITLLQFEKWDLPHPSMSIFEDQGQINRKVLARLTDVCDKRFSSLNGNQELIAKYSKDIIETIG